MTQEKGGEKVLSLTAVKNLYSLLFTKLNCSEMNEKNDILLKRQQKPQCVKHNTNPENRKMGISTHLVENQFHNSCRYFEVKYLPDS